MVNPMNRVMNGHLFKDPARSKRKQELSPPAILTLLGYTSGLVDKKWPRLAARGSHFDTQPNHCNLTSADFLLSGDTTVEFARWIASVTMPHCRLTNTSQ